MAPIPRNSVGCAAGDDAADHATLPILQALSVIDVTGNVIVNSQTAAPLVNVADRAFFTRYHLTHTDPEPRTSELIQSPGFRQLGDRGIAAHQ